VNTNEVATLAAFIGANWPAMRLTEDTIDVYRSELESIDATGDEALTALRVAGADRDFALTPMQLRDAIVRRRNPMMEWDEAYRELGECVARIGYTATLTEGADWIPPELAPELQRYVLRRFGSWLHCCEEMRAFNGFDDHSSTQAQVQQAQFRDEYRAIAARDHRERTAAALTEPTSVREIIGGGDDRT
jgi:hypothetical protein